MNDNQKQPVPNEQKTHGAIGEDRDIDYLTLLSESRIV